jgi:hypothetical protein
MFDTSPIRRTFRGPAGGLALLAAVCIGGLATWAGDKEQRTEEKPPASRDDGGRTPGKSRPAPPLKDLRLKNEGRSMEERIEASLDKPTEVNFIELPLDDALAFLREYHNVPIWIDRPALAESNIPLDTPITLQHSGARFESILNLLLEPIALDWLIQDEVLKVTTRERASATTETRVIDIQNLLDAGHEPNDLIESITRCIEPRSWARRNSWGGQDPDATGSIAHSGGTLICRQSQRVQSAILNLLLDLDDLARRQAEESAPERGKEVITLKVYTTAEFSAEELAAAMPKLVSRDAWEVRGTEIVAIKGALFVKQTPHVHREISRLLAPLTRHEAGPWNLYTTPGMPER